ncbi:hypothetical protein GCM10022291_27000 [Postechiella marina]|uniref:YhhN-like protein n=1 Tax=Postechiella marina TaxID=943941 RepID=A0ABP8CDT2_9FLAO
MLKIKALIGLVLFLFVGYSFYEFTDNDTMAFYLDGFIIPVIALIYLLSVRNKETYFVIFLACFTLADFIGMTVFFITNKELDWLDNLEYYVGNTLYILGYIAFSIKICKSLDFKYVLKHHKMHLSVLTVLGTYLIYVVQVIVKPNLKVNADFYLELVYNVVTFTLLSIALLNYFYRDNRKSLFLFLGTLCIVFSEMIDVAFIYISQKNLLAFIAGALSLLAYYFFLKQAKLENTPREEMNYMVTK